MYLYGSQGKKRLCPCTILTDSNQSNVIQFKSNKMQRYTVYLYLETALHVSDSTSAHHQERIQLYLQHLVFVTPLLLELSSNSSTTAAGSNNVVTNS
jgi:hypothetical protein